MPSLKEIRARINSVASTQKITNAMKMVSAGKLKKAESTTERFMPYMHKLHETLSNYLNTLEETLNIPLCEKRQVKKVMLMAFSSNNGLCGVYNANIDRLLKETYSEYVAQLGKDNVTVYLAGKKVGDYAKRMGIPVIKNLLEISAKPTYEDACVLCDLFTKLFLEGSIDKVELIYNHYKNTGVQIPQCEVLLPLQVAVPDNTNDTSYRDYIVEPSKEEFVNEMVPKVLRTNLFSIMLDAHAAEHGARTTTMHIASDNAEQLSQELRIVYNKARQEVITNELMDIVGGAEALSE